MAVHIPAKNAETGSHTALIFSQAPTSGHSVERFAQRRIAGYRAPYGREESADRAPYALNNSPCSCERSGDPVKDLTQFFILVEL